MPSYKCKNCNDPFTAREADRKRGWARFCSKFCKAKEQENRTGQYASYLNRQNSIEVFNWATSHGQWEDI